MALGIYKPGQGYWVRTLTAVFAGVLVLSAAAYGWSQAELARLPTRDYSVTLAGVQGEVAPGDQVDLYGPDLEGRMVDIGNARVVSFTPRSGGTGDLVLADPVREYTELEGDAVIAAQSVRVGGPNESAPAFVGRPTTVLANPIFPLVYVQAGVSGIIILIGAILIYWLVGVKKNTVEFLVNTDGEMRKVNWSSYREIRGSTIVVIVAAFLIAAILFGIDQVFSWFFQLIDVLEV